MSSLAASEERGRHYTPARKWAERLLSRLYRGGWARALADWHPGSSTVEVTRSEHTLAAWPAAMEPIRVVLLSDLHAGPTTSRRALADAFARAAEARPDLVLFGGDFVFLEAANIEELLPAMAALTAPLGRFAVLGNHDHWAGRRAVAAALASAGVRLLTNESVRVGPFRLVGIDDAWAGEPDAARAFADVAAGETVVVLAHAPEVLRVLAGRRADVIVCGHTHGGHLCLPGGVPLFVLGEVGQRYPRGRYRLPDGSLLVVGRGVGATESPWRAWARPEVVVVDLKGGST